MTCREAEDHFLAHSLGEPTPESFRAHIGGCAACRKTYAEFVAAGAVLRSLPPTAAKSGFADSVLAEVRRHEARASSAWWRLRRLVFHPAFAVGVAAAAVVAVVALGGLEREREMRAGPARIPATEGAAAPGPAEAKTSTPVSAKTASSSAEEAATEGTAGAPSSPGATAAPASAAPERRAPAKAHSAPAGGRGAAPRVSDLAEREAMGFAAAAPEESAESVLVRPVAPGARGGLAGGATMGTGAAEGGPAGGFGGGGYGGALGGRAGQPDEALGTRPPKGPIGPKGDKGPAGPAGPAGDAGASGQAASMGELFVVREGIQATTDFSFRAATVKDAIDNIALTGKLIVEVRAPLAGRPRVTVRLKSVTAVEALKRVCRKVGLEVEEAGDKRYVVVEPGEQP